MKKVSLLLVALLTVFITSLSVVAFAAPSDENPYKNHYVKEAQALRKQGTAKIIFQFMTRDNAPLPGVIMLYNTTKEKGQEAYADEKGMIQFDVKTSELYYVHHVIYNRTILPIQGSAMEYNMDVAQDPTTTSMELTGTVSVNGEKTGRLSVSSVRAENGEDGISYGFNTGIVSKDAIQLEVNVFGDVAADGASNNTISLEGRLPEASFALSFDAEISGDDIEDKVSAVEPDVVIDDLSDEAMENLFQDQNVSAVMAKIGASLTVDAGKLFQDQSMLNASALMNGEHLPIVVEDEPAADYDYTYEIDGDDGFVIDGMEEAEDDYEMAEDDGELGFEVPELTFLPQGWSVANVEADTAYDWVGISVADENGQECMYATFFQDMDGELTNYTVNEKGTVQQGRAMSVSDYGEGGLAVTLRENGLYGSLSFASGAIDVDTLGRIVAGIQF